MNNFYDEAYNMVGSGSFDKRNNVVIGSNHRTRGIGSLAIQRPSDSYRQVVENINASTRTPIVGYSFVNELGKNCTISAVMWERMQADLIDKYGAHKIKPIYADNMTHEQATRWATAGSYEQNFSKLLGGLRNE
jgi:hypothetical protein